MNEYIIPGGGAAAVVFIIGLFRGSKLYAAIRDALGVFSFNLGKSISRIGNTRLRGIYEPIEAPAVDFFLFMAEQLGAGLRSDNPEKLKEHKKRLVGVGSTTRKAAIEAKLAQIAPRCGDGD